MNGGKVKFFKKIFILFSYVFILSRRMLMDVNEVNRKIINDNFDSC